MPRKPKHPTRRALEQYFVRRLSAFGAFVCRWLSLRSVRRIATVLAWVIGIASPRRQRMMERNLRLVFGEALTWRQRQRIRKLSVINIAKTMAETIKLQWMTDAEVEQEVTVQGLEHLDQVLAQGRGAILITAHYGNWEYAGAILGIRGYPINVIARDAADTLTRDLINTARRSKRVKVFGRESVRELLRALQRNECVAILPDQHAKEGAVRVHFLGRPADTATGPAVFSQRTGAPVLPVFCRREPGDHMQLEVFPPLQLVNSGNREADVVANTQIINDALGEQIRAHPEQWLWLHDRWKSEADIAAHAPG